MAAVTYNWGPLLTADERESLSSQGHEVSYPPGTVVIRRGERSAFVLYLIDGHMKAVSPASGVILGLHGPDSVVGELALMASESRTADVITIGAVNALILPSAVWVDFVRSNARAACAHWADLARRQVGLDDVKGLSFTSSEHRVARALVNLAEAGIGVTTPDGTQFTGISQQDIAGIAKVSRDSASVILRRFREAGIVSTGRQKLLVIDMDAVHAIYERESDEEHERAE
ncbi:Crp/Fnr family transcriptional regulator [Glycomyces sp. NPDC047010]|uniref:Crp/Fnr family transcriptional regulator n=1 Tax=Glycomyces sp. NPDC047010 TaxID=3155023 RepID=UPI0033D28261